MNKIFIFTNTDTHIFLHFDMTSNTETPVSPKVAVLICTEKILFYNTISLCIEKLNLMILQNCKSNSIQFDTNFNNCEFSQCVINKVYHILTTYTFHQIKVLKLLLNSVFLIKIISIWTLKLLSSPQTHQASFSSK